MDVNILRNMTNNVGPLIRKYREAKGPAWTLDHVTRMLGRPSGWLSNLEIKKTKNLPEPEELRKIAEILDIPMTEMMIASGYLREEDLDAPPEDAEPIKSLLVAMRRVDWSVRDREDTIAGILDRWIRKDQERNQS